MKNILLVFSLCIACIQGNAQNSSPYEIFGHVSNVTYEMPVTEFLYIKNKDTSSDVKAMALDAENGYAVLLNKDDVILEKVKLQPEHMLRWLSTDPLQAKYPFASPYNFVLNTPIQAIDPDGKRVYFVGGANNDQDGWNYIGRFNAIFTNKGIEGFKRVNASHGKIGDVLFTGQYRNTSQKQIIGTGSRTPAVLDPANEKMIKSTVESIAADLTLHPLKEGEQFNLAGYSYGSVMQAQVAVQLANKGIKVDNLILIGSPISDNSDLMNELNVMKKEGRIGNILRHDIPGDKLSNPKTSLDYLKGGIQNGNDAGPHFDLARPDNPLTPNINEGNEANKRIGELADKLKANGVK